MRKTSMRMTAVALTAALAFTAMPVFAEEIDWTNVSTGENVAAPESGDYHSKGSGLTIQVKDGEDYKEFQGYSGSVLVEETDVHFITGPGVGITNAKENNCDVQVEIGQNVTKLNASESVGVLVNMGAGTGKATIGGDVNVESYQRDGNAYGKGIEADVYDLGQYSGNAYITVGGNITVWDGAKGYGVVVDNQSENDGSAYAKVEGDITVTPKSQITMDGMNLKYKTYGVDAANMKGTSTVQTGNITLNPPETGSVTTGVSVANVGGKVSVETGNIEANGWKTTGITADVGEGAETTVTVGNLKTSGEGSAIEIGESPETVKYKSSSDYTKYSFGKGKVTIETKDINSAGVGIEEVSRGNTVDITTEDIQAVTDAIRILGGSAGDTTTIKADNITAGDHAIAADLSNGGSLSVYVSGEMKSDKSLIQLTEGNTDAASNPGTLNVTAWKITGDTDHLVEVVDENKQPVSEGTGVQVNVDYIIKVNEVSNGQITLEGSNVRKNEETGDYLARADEKIVINVKADEGYELESASGGAATLKKNTDGTYTLTVPASGGVSLSAVMKAIQKQDDKIGQDGEEGQDGDQGQDGEEGLDGDEDQDGEDGLNGDQGQDGQEGLDSDQDQDAEDGQGDDQEQDGGQQGTPVDPAPEAAQDQTQSPIQDQEAILADQLRMAVQNMQLDGNIDQDQLMQALQNEQLTQLLQEGQNETAGESPQEQAPETSSVAAAEGAANQTGLPVAPAADTGMAPQVPALPAPAAMSQGTAIVQTDPAAEAARTALQNEAIAEFPDVPQDLSTRRLSTAADNQDFGLSTPISAEFEAAEPGLALSVTEAAAGAATPYRDTLSQSAMQAVDPNAVMLRGPFKIEAFANGAARRDSFGTVKLNVQMGPEYDGIPLKVFYGDAMGNYSYTVTQTVNGVLSINITQVGFLFITT